MLFERYLENLIIYGENLSLFYVVCALVSFLAVWFTWNIQPKINSTPSSENISDTSSDGFITGDSELSLASNISAERKTLLKNIENTLSVNDREKEILTEKQQLLDILNLMKTDEKFNSMTIEELEEQMKLYKD